ncbi:MAG: hypothetical protein V8R41_07770 [Dorea formicigenerans]
MIKILFGTITLSATLRLATPIIIAAVGGSFSHKAGTFNIAFECFMLFGAFFGAYGSYLTGSPMAGACWRLFQEGYFLLYLIICIYFKGKPDDYQYCYE